MAALLLSDVPIYNGETRVNVKCERESEGVSVRLGAYFKAGCETGGLHCL